MTRHMRWLALCALLIMAGCGSPISLLPASPSANDDTTPAGSSAGGAGGAVTLSGAIVAPQSGKWAPRAQAGVSADYTVLATSNQTGEVYRTTTDQSGQFEIQIPDSEAGNTFLVTILGPDGRTVGPVLFGQADGNGLTGLTPVGETSLGTIALPDDPLTAPIEPGSDTDLSDMIDPELTARLNDDGVPIGLASHGKGDDARVEGEASAHAADRDQDGLIDIFDADADGNGIVDDFEGKDAVGFPPDLRVNFFMNLKIGPELAPVYYGGTADEVSARLATDTIITFEVMTAPGATRSITAARMLETPAPHYLSIAEKMSDSATGLTFDLWSSSAYGFDRRSDRFDAFVRPNAEMDAGDTFTVEISFDDGSTGHYSRMINYVFKNIPKLLQYGSSSVRHSFDVTSSTIDGTAERPILFDGNRDLVLVFNPPLDETGAYLTGLDYSFQVFYEGPGGQLNADIDYDVTWPTPPPGFHHGWYWVEAGDLTLAADNTHTVTLPKELFPDAVALTSGATAEVDRYKIDITAEAPTGNAAIMLAFQKQ